MARPNRARCLQLQRPAARPACHPQGSTRMAEIRRDQRPQPGWRPSTKDWSLGTSTPRNWPVSLLTTTWPNKLHDQLGADQPWPTAQPYPESIRRFRQGPDWPDRDTELTESPCKWRSNVWRMTMVVMVMLTMVMYY